MLEKARAAHVKVQKDAFSDYGAKLDLFNGVENWFDRINAFGKEAGISVSHHIISSGIREMIDGTIIAKYFSNIYASSFCYDHHGVAEWPALALNYTTKTQYLFRINKNVKHVYDHGKINDYIPPSERPVPFTNMIFIGDGETDIPCFRLVKDKGGHSVAVYQPKKKGAKERPQKLLKDGRVNFMAPADYSEGQDVDRIVKAIMEKVAADSYLRTF